VLAGGATQAVRKFGRDVEAVGSRVPDELTFLYEGAASRDVDLLLIYSDEDERPP
jgi:hypothetical protein